MDKNIDKEEYSIIEKVEQVLQSQYECNAEFNDAFDAEETVEIQSSKDKDGKYQYKPSEVLFWTDRETYYEELEYWNNAKPYEEFKDEIEYLRKTDQISVFYDLVEAFSKFRIVPFVGAGISKMCGFPLWSEVLEKIMLRLTGVDLSDVRQALDRGDYLTAAQLLYELDQTQFINYVRTNFSFRFDKSKDYGVASILPVLCKGSIITTNFDNVLEEVFKESASPLDGYMHGVQQGNKFAARLVRGDRCILKLHGNYEDSDTYILTAQQYEQAYGSPFDYSKPLSRSLRQIFVSNSILFLGCSLMQDRALDLFRDVIAHGDFDIPDHFAILPELATNEEKRSKENSLLGIKIRTLWYPAGKHDFVLRFLRLIQMVLDAKVKLK